MVVVGGEEEVRGASVGLRYQAAGYVCACVRCGGTVSSGQVPQRGYPIRNLSNKRPSARQQAFTGLSLHEAKTHGQKDGDHNSDNVCLG